MLEPTSSRPVRKVAIADHLWDAFAEMAQAMGTDREGLINQAMFVFARLNGFLEGGGAARAARPGPPPLPVAVTSAPPVVPSAGVARTPAPEARATPPAPRSVDTPVRKQVAERVLETAAELERMIEDPRVTRVDPLGDLGLADTGEPQAEGDGALDVDALLQGLGTGPDAVVEPGLHLVTESGEAVRVGKDRFVIGRGKHCDYVIPSSKVSREHAAITRQGDDYFIEDLDSSNGTWFNKQRIKRRKVESGDEYYICSERIRLLVRGG